MRRNVIRLALCATLFALSFPARAQQPTKIPRIGVFVTGARELDRLRQALRERGYVEDKNIQIVHRFVAENSDRMDKIIEELLQLKVDVLVASGTTAIRAAKQATQTVPIVMMTTQDPVAIGLVDSLARPGGNLTGVANLTRELSGKRLELFKEAVPRLSRVGIFWVSPTTLGAGNALQNYQAAASALKIVLISLQVQRPTPDIEGAFRSAENARVNALIMVTNAVLNPHANRIADLAIRKRLPLMVEGIDFVEQGGLISYTANDADRYLRVAIYVDKILKGAKPADLPVEQPMKFELVINLKTAKQIGLTIPPEILARANRIIR
jgi:ABC-type uncharacterized transport system substrate-binding protein